jgi:flagellar biosynthesis protein
MGKKEKERAVALRYDEHKESAPRVIAKGEGHIAQKIKQIAQENNIPVHQDATLIELLAQVNIDYEIPPELYAAVAEVLCWIYRADNALKENFLK